MKALILSVSKSLRNWERDLNPKPSARRIQTRQEKQEVNDDVLTFDRLVVICMSKLKMYDLNTIK